MGQGFRLRPSLIVFDQTLLGLPKISWACIASPVLLGHILLSLVFASVKGGLPIYRPANFPGYALVIHGCAYLLFNWWCQVFDKFWRYISDLVHAWCS